MKKNIYISSFILATSATGSMAADVSADKVVALEEVIVTAQKRDDNIQRVPLAITAVSGEEVAKSGVNTLSELSKFDPSFSYNTNLGQSASGATLRGIGTTQTFSTGIEQTVSTVVDGVVLVDPTAVNSLGDIESIEILRGPQGMLFGKNAAAGVISIKTRMPVLDEFEGNATVSAGNRGDRVFNGTLNLPLGDTVAARISAARHTADGAVKNVYTGKDIDEVDVWSGRAKVLWQPKDDFYALLSVDHSNSDHFCCGAMTWRDLTPGSPADGTNQLYGIKPGPKNDKVAQNFQNEGYTKVTTGSLTLEGDWNDYTLTSITGGQNSKQQYLVDVDLSTLAGAENFGVPEARYKNISQELRLTSPLGETFDYVAGLYYWNSSVDSTVQQGYGVDVLALLAGPGLPAGQALAPSKVDSTSKAIFINSNTHLTDELTITAGLRYTRDESTLKISQSVTADFPPPLNVPPFTDIYCGLLAQCGVHTTQHADENNISWRISPQYQLTADTMVYVSAARGYKGPGFNTVDLGVPNANGVLDSDLTVGSENPLAFEAGIKSSALEHRVQYSFTLFHTDYDDFQAQIYITKPVGLGQALANAPLTSNGAEFSVAAQLTNNLRFDFAAAYLDASFGKVPGSHCYVGAPECAANPAGTFTADGVDLPGASPWAYNTALSYEQPNLLTGVDGFTSLTWNWRAAQNYLANGDPLAEQGAYGLLGGDIGLRGKNWTLSVYGRNLLDKRWVANIQDIGGILGGAQAHGQIFGVDSFRRVGVKLDVNF